MNKINEFTFNHPVILGLIVFFVAAIFVFFCGLFALRLEFSGKDYGHEGAGFLIGILLQTLIFASLLIGLIAGVFSSVFFTKRRDNLLEIDEIS